MTQDPVRHRTREFELFDEIVKGLKDYYKEINRHQRHVITGNSSQSQTGEKKRKTECRIQAGISRMRQAHISQLSADQILVLDELRPCSCEVCRPDPCMTACVT